MDGTFTSCPDLWNQVSIIHARSRSCMCPFVFALLPVRQTTTYTRLFGRLKTEVQQRFNRPLAPATVQADFERAAIRAVNTELPNADVKGCFFHYCQAIWRKTQGLGLAVQYKEDPGSEELLDLPSCPCLMSRTPGWMLSRQLHQFREDFNDYMVINWVDDDARFPIPLWNHHQTAGPRTNNNLEGFHHRLNRTLPHRHPNIYRFVEVIKKIECADRTKTVRLWCRPTQQEASLQID
ncbi:uncharacterized protein LOC125374801 [Haliotis rufescens]|uniref:uncharacterized protein LOC125374801 n=1 Tax=Haliotis rufescens TaxID=6454 RepID=UPI00201FAB61|nr:uncharacterized protein LOC125374801 [Haliotis rufescens]